MSVVFPYNEKNAIKSAAFALEFDKEFDENILNAIKKLYLKETQFQEEFPKEESIQTVKMRMGTNIQEISTLQLGGLSYTKSSADSFEWRLLIQGNIVSITCSAYTRWDEVWGFSKRYFEKILPLLKDNKLTKIILEYLDEFNINNLSENKWLGELFKDTSPYMPQFVYEMKEPWHTHNGFISKRDNRQTINLVNMNFLLNNVGSATLLMQTQHASSLFAPLTLNTEKNEIDTIETTMKVSHEFNKEMLREHLSQTMLDQIGLKVD